MGRAVDVWVHGACNTRVLTCTSYRHQHLFSIPQPVGPFDTVEIVRSGEVVDPYLQFLKFTSNNWKAGTQWRRWGSRALFIVPCLMLRAVGEQDQLLGGKAGEGVAVGMSTETKSWQVSCFAGCWSSINWAFLWSGLRAVVDLPKHNGMLMDESLLCPSG